MTNRKETSMMYMMALERLNKHFRQYNQYSTAEACGKLLHFTSRQFCNIPNLMKFYQKGPSVPEQFEEMRHNVELLKDLKITCAGEYIVELQQFHSLEHLYIVGPCLRAVKGLRSASTNLKSLIVENGIITVNDLLSLCCMDESRPMSWPCLMTLKISNCSLTSLDSSLKLLPNLQELDLSFNRLMTTGTEFCSLDQLTHLNLAFNQIREISQFNGGIRWQLQYLYLSYNELSTLEGLHVLENLLELDLSHNMLLTHDDLQPLRYLGLLQKLDLQGNPLSFNSHHRKMSLRCISPQALKPDFIFDGKYLTQQDLEVGQYTPNAIPASTYRFAVGEFASINSLEAEAYDVSMSSTANTSSRHAEGDSYFKLCSQNLKKKRLASKALVKIEASHPECEAPSIQPHAAGAEKLSGDEFSVASQASADCGCGSISCTSASDGLLESDHDESQGVTGDYLTLGGAAEIDDEDDADSLQSTHNSVVHSVNSSSVQDLPTIDNSTSSEKLDIAHSIVPSLRVKRLPFNAGDGVLPSGVEICLTLTSNHLVESSITDGTVLEMLELGCVKNVTMPEKQVMEVKFSYMKPERRTRRYAFNENHALEDLNQLFGELDLASLRNNKSRNQEFTCLKCSHRFSAANVLSKDMHGNNVAMICRCGSDLVVRTDDQTDDKKLFFFADDEECQEAFESRVVKDEQYASTSINVGGQSVANYGSLSWIHTLHSVPDVARVFGQSRGMHGSDESHLSESLPNDLSGVSLQPQYSNLRSTVSATVVNSTQQLVTPSKTFSYLLAPHPDLYKLVNVTSSMAAGQSKNITGLSVEPMSKSKFEGCDPESTPQVAKLTEQTGDLTNAAMHRVMVTSTPRRRQSQAQSATLSDSCPAKSPATVEIPHRRRALAFDETGEAPLSGNEAVGELSEQTPLSVDLKDHTAVDPIMKKFIDEELLEVKEELVSVFQTGLLRETGALLGSLPSLVASGSKRVFFRSPKLSKFQDSSPSLFDNEIVALLVLSNVNIHILQATKQRNLTLQENLKSFATHPLRDLVGLDIGLTGCTLYIAFESSQEWNKKFLVENIGEVYALQFRDSVKCKRFYHSCKGLLLDTKEEFGHSDIKDLFQSANSSEKNDLVEFSSPFSDFLEKSFSEDVLMHLDLHMPDNQNQMDGLLKDELFSYNPCWMLNDETSKEVAVAVVVSCGGSLCIVVEDIKQVLYEFVTAVARSKQERTVTDFRSDSISSSANTSFFGIPSSSIQVRSSVHYTFESLTECSKLKNVIRFNDQPECMQLNFDPTKDSDCNHRWHLRFSESHSAITLQRILEAYYEAENESPLPVLLQ